MASVVRALRPLRRELDTLRRNKPQIQLQFETAAECSTHLEQLRDYYKLLSARKASFERIQTQYLSLVWTTEADQTSAAEQAENDTDLLAKVDTVLSEVKCAIRRLSDQKAKENATAAAPQGAQQPAAAASAVVTRLPKLAFPTFDGNIMNWQQFWDRFRVTVHDNPSLTPVDKLSFLVGQLNGEAASTISGLAITEANYETALKMLRERYGNTSVIIDSHYNALMEMAPATKLKDLHAIIDKIELHLNALNALGEDVNHHQFATLIRSKLPPAILVQMENKREGEEEWDVDTLREQLRKYVKICETAYSKQSAKGGERTSNSPPTTWSSNRSAKKSQWQSTTSALLSQAHPQFQQRQQKAGFQQQWANQTCPYCNQMDHFAEQCTRITTATAREKKLQEKRLCFNCLESSHSIQQCLHTKLCYTCRKVKHHHSSICPQKFLDNHQTSPSATNPQQIKFDSSQVQSTRGEHQLLAPTEISLLQTATAVFISSGSQSTQANGIFDNGSQRSYITEKLANQLQLRPVSTAKLSVFTFGSAPPKEINSKVVKISIRLLDGTIFTYTANVVPVITGNIQSAPINNKQLQRLLRDLPMVDKSIPIGQGSIPIDFLIGSDYMWDFVLGEQISLANGLHLINFKLGWVLGGQQQDSNQHRNTHAALTTAALCAGEITENDSTAMDIRFLWDQEKLGIKEPVDTSEDEIAMRKFKEMVVYHNGRYFMTWPWREQEIDLPTNYSLALGHLKSLIRRYSENKAQLDIFEKYHHVIQTQIQKGIIEKVDAGMDLGPRHHYIPHHAVITPEKSTKLRIVYNASAKASKNMKSLNECLYRGPILLDDIVAILLHFCMNRIEIAADIEKAFLQVGLQESDHDVTQFLWLQDPSIRSVENNLRIYRFTRVPFGFTSSPFLLAVTIQHHLQQDGSEMAKQILWDIYVDNIITGVDDLDQATEFYSKMKKLFQSANMNAREWMTNSNTLASYP